MFANNLRLLCTSLGFTAVILKDNVPKENRAVRAVAIARMIEEFCRVTNPASFPQTTHAAADYDDTKLDRMIEELKQGEFHAGKLAELETNKALLRQVYDLLIQRHRAYAPDTLIADDVARLLEEEINHAVEADMMIVNVQGNTDAFAPCERMATAIVEILKSKGECFPNDLVAKGFTPDEIKRHWAMAYGLAKVELNWMDA